MNGIEAIQPVCFMMIMSNIHSHRKKHSQNFSMYEDRKTLLQVIGDQVFQIPTKDDSLIFLVSPLAKFDPFYVNELCRFLQTNGKIIKRGKVHFISIGVKISGSYVSNDKEHRTCESISISMFDIMLIN